MKLTKEDYMQTETWKSIKDYAMYQVSSFGNVRRVGGKVLKQKCGKDRYCRVQLSKEGKVKQLLVHRLVAEAFIPNPNQLPIINHKDEVRSNNAIFLNPDGSVNEEKSNLEWCTYSYNLNYGKAKEKWRAKTLNGRLSKPVCQYDKDGSLICTYPSIKEASRQLHISPSGIASCCLKYPKNTQAGGYLWKFQDDSTPIKPKPKILQYKDGILINTFYRVTDASRTSGVSHSAISQCLRKKQKTAGGYIWELN